MLKVFYIAPCRRFIDVDKQVVDKATSVVYMICCALWGVSVIKYKLYYPPFAKTQMPPEILNGPPCCFILSCIETKGVRTWRIAPAY